VTAKRIFSGYYLNPRNKTNKMQVFSIPEEDYLDYARESVRRNTKSIYPLISCLGFFYGQLGGSWLRVYMFFGTAMLFLSVNLFSEKRDRGGSESCREDINETNQVIQLNNKNQYLNILVIVSLTAYATYLFTKYFPEPPHKAVMVCDYRMHEQSIKHAKVAVGQWKDENNFIFAVQEKELLDMEKDGIITFRILNEWAAPALFKAYLEEKNLTGKRIFSVDITMRLKMILASSRTRRIDSIITKNGEKIWFYRIRTDKKVFIDRVLAETTEQDKKNLRL